MKKKSENKKLSKAESTPDIQVSKEMSDEDFDRYIDGIMVEGQEEVNEQTAENQAVMADDIQSLREDFNTLLNKFDALSEYLNQERKVNEAIREVSNSVPASDVAASQNVQPVQPVQTPLPQQQPVSDAEKARLYDSMIEENKRREMFKKHMADQEADIKKDFADFEFKSLYDTDPVFRAEFDRLGSLYGAYLKYLAQKMASGNVSPARNFVENGAMPAFATGSISTSPAGLPDKEFEEYIRNIMGE